MLPSDLEQIKTARDLAKRIALYCIVFNGILCVAAFYAHKMDEKIIVAALLTLSTLLGLHAISRYRRFKKFYLENIDHDDYVSN